MLAKPDAPPESTVLGYIASLAQRFLGKRHFSKERSCAFTGHELAEMMSAEAIKRGLPLGAEFVVRVTFHGLCSGKVVGVLYWDTIEAAQPVEGSPE
jgi:hypothetical protein